MSNIKDGNYMEFWNDCVNEKYKERKVGDDMSLTEFVDSIGLDINNISVKELPLITRLSQDIKNLHFEINELKKRTHSK